MSIHGKVALVTGSTSGIGKAVVETLARHGAKVVITGRDQERGKQIAVEIQRTGGEAFFTAADLANKEAPRTLVQKTVDRWGRIDIVVNNAAMVSNKPIEDVVHEDWDRLFAINLKTPFFIIQSALPWLVQSGGAVINISSINGIGNMKNNIVYDTLKAGLNHMTRGWSMNLREKGIRFNALMPGGVATPLLNQWFHQIIEDPQQAEHEAERCKLEPNVASPQQIADAVLFLAGKESSWVNGAIIPIDGGYHLG